MTVPVFQPGYALQDGTTLEQLVIAIFGTGVITAANYNPQGGAGFTALYVSGFVQEGSTDGIVAGTVQTQAGATALTTELNRVATVATSGNGVRLPASQFGLTIWVENAGANPMQVYGTGTDTINGVAGSTGVAQMQSSVVVYTCYSAGAWFAEGLGGGYAGSLSTISATTGITAYAAGGQAGATQLVAMLNNVTTAAAANASVVLPASSVGLQITVSNNGANTIAVFCPSGSSMNGTSNGSATLATSSVGIYFCVAAGQWLSK